MIDSMFEPHMKDKEDALQTEAGLTFMIYALVYTFSVVAAGYVNN
jgi:hypothetical protein